MRFIVFSSLIFMTLLTSACEKTIHDVRAKPVPTDLNVPSDVEPARQDA